LRPIAGNTGKNGLLNTDGSLNMTACTAIADEADAYFRLEREIANDESTDAIEPDGAGGYRRAPRHA
jgi:hypothetical protein